MADNGRLCYQFNIPLKSIIPVNVFANNNSGSPNHHTYHVGNLNCHVNSNVTVFKNSFSSLKANTGGNVSNTSNTNDDDGSAAGDTGNIKDNTGGNVSNTGYTKVDTILATVSKVKLCSYQFLNTVWLCSWDFYKMTMLRSGIVNFIRSPDLPVNNIYHFHQIHSFIHKSAIIHKMKEFFRHIPLSK